MNLPKLVQEPKFWLVAVAGVLMALQLTLSDRFEQVELFGTSMLAWGAVSFLIWEKHSALNLKSSVFAKFFGATLVALVFAKTVFLSSYDPFLRFFPLISGLGLGLVASDLKGLKQYWQELIILAFPILAPAPAFLVKLVDISPITAKSAAMMLWYSGFNVRHEGLFLHLPTGSVEVGSGCSGLSVILQLLGLALLVLFMFPTTLGQKIIVPIVAVLVGFVVNSGRVALMAVLVASSNPQSFEYWHFGQGSLIFSMIAVLIFGLITWFAILREQPENQDA
ncbi:cyanoexosortase A [Microcoleus sp. FACHB-68]|uniref:cyanoexosortase A n=1 Tax=Microcoleus sp. FACHB-68 TaxID=2692826 RepID=UPI001681EC75|nr:cyanoexosortase A [Microcoleus sp. FACHB-68]MBD1937457.1 cyanoexosortase A [Microcoleus sp. FACHB-68]